MLSFFDLAEPNSITELWIVAIQVLDKDLISAARSRGEGMGVEERREGKNKCIKIQTGYHPHS